MNKIVIKIIVLLIITSLLLGCYQKIDKTTEKSVINPDEEKKDMNGFIKKETEHFIFNYKIDDKKAVDDLAKILEENYERIINDIKPTIELSTIKVFVYPSIDEFHKAVYKPDASDGFVGYAISATEFAIVSPNNPGTVHNYEYMLKTAVHEFTHIVVGSLRMPPRWLNESIALYEAKQFIDPSNLKFMMKGEHPNFANNNFVSMDSRVYAIGYTIIEFMVEKWSMEKVRKLIKEKGNLEDNMIKILNVTPREFEKQWFNFVYDKYLKN